MALHLPRETGEEVVTHLHAGGRAVGRGLVDDDAHAAEVDVAVVGNEVQGGRRDVDRDALLEDGLVALEPVPQRGVAGGDAQHGRAFLDARHLRQRDGDLLLAGRRAELLRRQGSVGPTLRQRDRDGLQARALVGHLEIKRRKAHRVGIGRQAQLRRIGLETRVQVPGSSGKGSDDEQKEDYDGGFAAGIIGGEGAHFFL